MYHWTSFVCHWPKLCALDRTYDIWTVGLHYFLHTWPTPKGFGQLDEERVSDVRNDHGIKCGTHELQLKCNRKLKKEANAPVPVEQPAEPIVETCDFDE